MNEYNGKSSDQIKADIERTRSEMTEKIDTIQERLSPDNLKLQAQSMVQDILQESSDAITDFIKSSTQQAGRGLVETVKKNPLPSAVVGLGIGWLMMNMVNDQRSDSSDRHQGYGRSYDRNYDRSYDMGGRMGGQMGYRSSMDAGRGMSEGSMLGARVPYSGAAADDAYGANYVADYGYEEWQEPDGQYSDSRSGGLGEKAGQAAGKAGEVAGKAGHLAKDAAGKVGETAQNIAGTVTGAVQNAAGAVGDAAQSVAGRVGDAAGSVAEPATQMGQQVRHGAMRAGRQVAHQAGSLGSQTQHQAARAGRQVQRTLEDNPMAFGAAALLAGLAIGLALPATRQERQLLGDVRDQVMDKAQNMVSSFTEEAKQVVEEVKPRLEQTAQKVVGDLKASSEISVDELKRTAKEAGQEIKQSLHEAGATVKSRVEDTTGMSLSSDQGEETTEIVSGTIVDGDQTQDQTQPEPNVGGGYDSKFDTKS